MKRQLQVDTYDFIYINSLDTRIYIYIYIYVCVCVCVYVFIYSCIYMRVSKESSFFFTYAYSICFSAEKEHMLV